MNDWNYDWDNAREINEWTVIPSTTTTTNISIEGLDRSELLKRLFDAVDNSWYDVYEEVDELAARGFGYIENLAGIPLKTDFSKTMVNTYYYNKFTNQNDLFERIVADIWARQCKNILLK